MNKILISIGGRLTEKHLSFLIDVFNNLNHSGEAYLHLYKFKYPALSQWEVDVKRYKLTAFDKLKFIFYFIFFLLLYGFNWYINIKSQKILKTNYLNFIFNHTLNFYKIYTIKKINHFCCWNNHHYYFGIYYDFCSILKIKTSIIEWGYIPDSFILDKSGYAGESSIASSSLNILIQDNYQILTNIGKECIFSINNIDINIYNQKFQSPLLDQIYRKKINGNKILFLGINEYDQGCIPFYLKSKKTYLNRFNSCLEISLEISKRLNNDDLLIFKPHPTRNKYQEEQISTNHFILNVDPNILIDWADLVITVGSKLELNVLLKGKKLFLLHSGVFWNKDCAIQSNDVDELISNLNFSSNIHINSLYLYTGYLLNKYMFLPEKMSVQNFCNFFK
ncbi:MAG: hypothetical protein SFU91_06155 [Chloroherpetonaceae bacterium]|nr:hypothetical protein [Chloroherpetonaceae bacterium]